MSNQVGGALLDMVLGLLGIDGSARVGPYGEGGVATIVLDLENGYTVKHSWVTDAIKFRAGNEHRSRRNDTDHESYAGSAYFLAGAARNVRARLARYAALGSRFLLALPHEAIALAADASGTTIPVASYPLSLCDWARPGQRVVVVGRSETDEPVAVDAVVQSTTSDTIELDVDPGDVGVYGAEIMPAKAIYLEPQQDFPRYPVDVEIWNLAARAATPLDFAPAVASIPLSSLSAPFANAIATSRVFGLPGNLLTLDLVGSIGYPDDGQLIEVGVLTTFRYKPGVTTLGDLATALESSANFLLTGSWDPDDTFGAFDDLFITAMGGSAVGEVGTGESLTAYDGDGTERPVWTQPLADPSTVTDGAMAMTQILDHGGIPYALGLADQADWFRAVMIEAGDRQTWQWFKLFMSTVIGQQKKFWLATWRKDLEYVSHSGTSLTIDADEGDFTAWWPRLREHLQIEQADGTVTYAKITDAVNNLDGTRTLALSEPLSGSAVTRLGWLELCRFETADSYETRHDADGFYVSLTARVVP